MVNRPSTPEIITVNSETLQTQIRDLLPSQNGFGSELQASNVITPIIDLTSAAEGSGLPNDLARAVAFGSQTEFEANSSTVVLANSPGFYRIFGCSTLQPVSTTNVNSFTMTDGATIKTVWAQTIVPSSNPSFISIDFDFVVWLATGISISAVTNQTGNILIGSIRQVADSTGTLVNPSGYPL